MADAWGGSWGTSWGISWGADSPTPPTPTGGADGISRKVRRHRVSAPWPKEDEHKRKRKLNMQRLLVLMLQ